MRRYVSLYITLVKINMIYLYNSAGHEINIDDFLGERKQVYKPWQVGNSTVGKFYQIRHSQLPVPSPWSQNGKVRFEYRT